LLTYASLIEIPGAPRQETVVDEGKDLIEIVRSGFAKHHLLWLDRLQKVENGEIRRLMGLMPPGSAKSTYTSVVFPTHYLGRFRNHTVIVASYGSELPRKFGRRARSIVQQPVYKEVFEQELRADTTAADEWALTNNSEWMAAGILTGITGNRVDGVIWDDLIKGRDQADSEQIRQKTWEAYFDDLLTRKKPSSWEVGITTRWHEDDPAGRILPDQYNGESGWIKCKDGNDWYVVCLPAEAEREDDILGRRIGEILWPEWFTPAYFSSFKRNARTWNALFQQRPAPETGDFFKSEWLKPYFEDQIPDRETLTIYGASDYAVTDKEGDYTVHMVVGADPEDRLYLLDLWRGRTSPDVWVEKLCDLIEQWRPMGWVEESGQIHSGIGPYIHKRLMERHLYVARTDFPPRAVKQVRAQPIRGYMAMVGLHVPVFKPWYPIFKAELMVFPAGRHDDQVDALSLLGQVLDRMIRGKAKSAPPEPLKVISTDPAQCNVTLTELFEANDNSSKAPRLRIY
jgi:predicted phage terminase large subunit-like protein